MLKYWSSCYNVYLWVHCNTYDPSCMDPFLLARTRYSDYKKCDNQSLIEVMIQMDIEPFISVRAVRELLSKIISERKYIDRHMINNVRIHAWKKLELEYVDIEIDPKYFNTSFISTYSDTSDNYTEGKFLIVILFDFHVNMIKVCQYKNGMLIQNVWY